MNTPPRPPLQQLTDAEQAWAWLRTCVPQRGTAQLRSDSRRLRAGDVFVAWPGAASDGRAHVAAALKMGAAACLVEADGVEPFGFDDSRVAALRGLKAAAGGIASRWYGEPSQALKVLAITGTNGKTSTSWWLAQALVALGQRCGVVGTLGMGEIGASLAPSGLTTPDPLVLQAQLREMADGGLLACSIEASSIGLQEQRLAGTHIDVALFTNLTQDHLDYHGSMAAYGQAKRALFDRPGLRAAVLNVDDAMGLAWATALQKPELDLWTVALEAGPQPARLQAAALQHQGSGLSFTVQEHDQAGSPLSTPQTVRTSLVGQHNASNLMVVLGGLRALGLPLVDACAALGRLQAVPGRLQRVLANGSDSAEAEVEVVVDYAHTPDALHKVLAALQPLAQARSGQLWCVLGCGGDRDAGKRPLMAAAAQAGAQRVVLTSDNPRSEDPARILAQMLAGVRPPTPANALAIIADRRAAIAHAVREAHAGDVVLLAGKGHETTQEVAGVKLPFSDVEEAQVALALRPMAETLQPVPKHKTGVAA